MRLKDDQMQKTPAKVKNPTLRATRQILYGCGTHV